MSHDDQILNFHDLEDRIDGKLIQLSVNQPVNEIFIDSRKPIVAHGSTFIALSGERHNGHDYIKDLYHQGVRNFIIDSEIDTRLLPEANIFQSSSSLLALQKLAQWKRKYFSSKLHHVIGITGSNGKTIVKEWLSIILEKKYNVVKSPGSYNSQVGVPLSVWKIESNHNLGVFEAGISRTGEMESLEKIIQPALGVITNIGTAHDQGFRDRFEKAREKCRLFENCNAVIYSSEYEEIDQALKKLKSKREIQLLDWSFGKESVFTLLQKDAEKISISFKGETFEFSPPFSDAASLENLTHCICTLLFLGYTEKEIDSGLSLLHPVKMRLELKKAKNDCYIIDDTYNNDVSALEVALDFLMSQKHKKKRRLILSDILQAHEPDEKLYSRINELLKSRNIDSLVGIGNRIQKQRDLFSMDATFYESTEAFLDKSDRSEFSDEIILIKGARPFHFEKVVEAFEDKTHDTELIINLSALTHNLNFYRSQLSQDTRIMVMVKAFAYGSGSLEVASLLQYHKVDYLAVAYADEGIFLRKNGIHLPVMVMNSREENFNLMKRYRLEPEVFSLKMLKEILEYSDETNSRLDIHLKIDSGMNRLGFLKEDIDELCTLLSKNAGKINVKSAFTHLAASDDSGENDFSKKQIALYLELVDRIEKSLGCKVIRHALNSPGIVQFPDFHLEMVRLGIGLYGIDTTGKQQNQLQPIGTLKSRIAQVKKVEAGETIGYARMGKAEKDMEIAVINIGYADGYDRRFSNGKGRMLLHGKSIPVIGNVCMDMTMVDVTGINAKEGDEVVVFGSGLSIIDLAKEIDTIPYELLTNVGQRVKRVFINE